jgi:ParB-like chromosome segregation protein Spo0J
VEDLSEEDAQPAERSAKHRRCRDDAEDRQEEDARRARELHQQHQQAEAAQRESFEAGKGGFGSDVALSLAAQRFVLEVQEARTKAMAKGIDPHVNGKDLIQLTPAELQAWVQEKLGDAGP